VGGATASNAAAVDTAYCALRAVFGLDVGAEVVALAGAGTLRMSGGGKGETDADPEHQPLADAGSDNINIDTKNRKTFIGSRIQNTIAPKFF
jgi:hypothetical protein